MATQSTFAESTPTVCLHRCIKKQKKQNSFRSFNISCIRFKDASFYINSAGMFNCPSFLWKLSIVRTLQQYYSLSLPSSGRFSEEMPLKKFLK